MSVSQAVKGASTVICIVSFWLNSIFIVLCNNVTPTGKKIPIKKVSLAWRRHGPDPPAARLTAARQIGGHGSTPDLVTSPQQSQISDRERQEVCEQGTSTMPGRGNKGGAVGNAPESPARLRDHQLTDSSPSSPFSCGDRIRDEIVCKPATYTSSVSQSGAAAQSLFLCRDDPPAGRRDHSCLLVTCLSPSLPSSLPLFPDTSTPRPPAVRLYAPAWVYAYPS